MHITIIFNNQKMIQHRGGFYYEKSFFIYIYVSSADTITNSCTSSRFYRRRLCLRPILDYTTSSNKNLFNWPYACPMWDLKKLDIISSFFYFKIEKAGFLKNPAFHIFY